MAKNMYQKREERRNKKLDNSENQEVLHKTNINWYPGHMAKTKRLIKENLNLIDLVYEVIDARIPFSSKIKDIDELIKNKEVILVMTKYDLCDKKETDKFINNYEKLGYHVYKTDLINDKSINKLIELSREVLKEKRAKLTNKGIARSTIRALVIGVPNVGKSTLINKLLGKKSAKVGNTPGVTKQLSWLRASNDIEILDTPGILWPKLDQITIAYNLATMSAIKEEILPLEDIAVYIIKTLYKYYPNILKEQYDVTNIDDFEEVFDVIGKKNGFLQKGGIIDYDKVVTLIVNDIKSGKIKNITFDRYIG